MAYLGAMLAHLGGMLAYLEGYVGPSWSYVGPSWGYVGSSWGYVGPSWGYLGPSWGYVGPSSGLCWPILLAQVDPILSHKIRKQQKNATSTKHRKTRGFWRHVVGGSGSAAGAAAPLSYGEERTAVRLCHGQGAPGRIYEAYA